MPPKEPNYAAKAAALEPHLGAQKREILCILLYYVDMFRVQEITGDELHCF